MSQEAFLRKFPIELLIQHLAQTSYSPTRSSIVPLLQEDEYIYRQWTFIKARMNKGLCTMAQSATRLWSGMVSRPRAVRCNTWDKMQVHTLTQSNQMLSDHTIPHGV